jgi:hypothetical protein
MSDAQCEILSINYIHGLRSKKVKIRMTDRTRATNNKRGYQANGIWRCSVIFDPGRADGLESLPSTRRSPRQTTTVHDGNNVPISAVRTAMPAGESIPT